MLKAKKKPNLAIAVSPHQRGIGYRGAIDAKKATVPASYQTKAENGESPDFIRSGPFTVASVKFIKNKLVSFDSFAKIYYNKKATAYRLRFRKGQSRIFFRERGRNEGTHKMEVHVPDGTLHHVGFGNLLEPFL